MIQIILKFSFIFISILKNQLANAPPQTIFHTSFIYTIIFMYHFDITVSLFIFEKLPFVETTIGIAHFAQTVLFVILNFSYVNVIIGINNFSFSFSFFLVLGKFAYIVGTIFLL